VFNLQRQIVNADAYMPMTVNDLEQYDDTIEAGFYVSGISRDEITSVWMTELRAGN